ncbi:MAG TPA: hypothetical protein VJR06_09565 [Nitrososphaerales archaeon]|nr:hypothetical protein [Nitrososphaerales archaeon]
MTYQDTYAYKWANHADTVKWLAGKFADMGFEVWFGYGARDAGKMVSKNGDPNEPDIFVAWKGEKLAGIEVTGSERARVPPGDIYVRKSKLDHAMKSDIPVWFYMVYQRHYVLRTDDVWPYREHTTKVGQDRDPYVVVPCTVGKPIGALFDWLKEAKGMVP